VTYSYTQITQYLTCPRRYRFRYLAGWKESDNRAAMLLGRAFELAPGAYFRREDPRDVFFREWSGCKDQGLHFSNHERRNNFGSDALGLKRQSDFVIEVVIPPHDLLFWPVSVHRWLRCRFGPPGRGLSWVSSSCHDPLQRLAIVPWHPLRGTGRQLLGVALQFGQVVEGVGAAQLAGVNQALTRRSQVGAEFAPAGRLLSREQGSSPR